MSAPDQPISGMPQQIDPAQADAACAFHTLDISSSLPFSETLYFQSNTMARTFHLSCMGPIEPNSYDLPLTAVGLQRFFNDSHAIDAILNATPLSPIKLNPHGNTLPKAQALDAALLRLGIHTQICLIDSTQPSIAHVFINERQGDRRTSKAPSYAEQRKSPGRRYEDQAR